MKKRRKVGFTTKLLSNHYYLNEIPVEGKTTSKFHFTIGWYDQYTAQIIKTGNCITLLSTYFTLTDESFWNINYFEDLTKYVFWTFNKSFLFKVSTKLETLTLPVLQHCNSLLTENFVPYEKELTDETDEELQFCYAKNNFLKKDPQFSPMYLLDRQNRTSIKDAVEKRINEFTRPVSESIVPAKPIIIENESKVTSSTTWFLDALKPTNGSAQQTLEFIIQKTEEARFDFNIFSKVHRLDNGKNPYGLNGCIAAMIDIFYQLNYFKKEYSLEEIFKAYLQYSGNTIGKLKTFVSEFRQDNSYIKHFDSLKKLKINKLQ